MSDLETTPTFPSASSWKLWESIRRCLRSSGTDSHREDGHSSSKLHLWWKTRQIEHSISHDASLTVVLTGVTGKVKSAMVRFKGGRNGVL